MLSWDEREKLFLTSRPGVIGKYFASCLLVTPALVPYVISVQTKFRILNPRTHLYKVYLSSLQVWYEMSLFVIVSSLLKKKILYKCCLIIEVVL